MATKPLKDMPGHSVTPVPMRKDGSIAAMSNPMFKGDPPYTGAWADCAYDPETPGPIYHPDQVCVHVGIDEALRQYAKAAIREQPEDVLEWSRCALTRVGPSLRATVASHTAHTLMLTVRVISVVIADNGSPHALRSRLQRSSLQHRVPKSRFPQPIAHSVRPLDGGPIPPSHSHC